MPRTGAPPEGLKFAPARADNAGEPLNAGNPCPKDEMSQICAAAGVGKIGLLLLTALVSTGGLSTVVRAQEPPPEPIRHLLVDANEDDVPDRLGETFAVRGVLTSDPLRLGRNVFLANFQDTTAGLVLFSRDSTVLSGLAQGDSIHATGILARYRGATRLNVERVRRLGHPGAPRPWEVLARDVFSDRMRARLVRLSGELVVRRTEEGWLRVELRDRSASVPVLVSGAWLSNPDFLADLTDGRGVEITGVAGQLATFGEDNVVTLIPRGPEDFRFSPRPPYAAMAAAAIGIMALLLTWWWFREARRGRELACLARELEQSRDALAAREKRFRSLVEHSADTVSILDSDGLILYQSPSVTRILGWPADEIVGTNLLDLVHAEDRTVVAAALEGPGSERAGADHIEVRLRGRSGDWRVVEATMMDRSDDLAVQGIVCNLHDVTAHRQLEQRLRQADRMEAVGRLTGGVAHDFNNILTAIVGHTEFVLMGLEPGHAVREDAREIVRAADRATSLVRQLLAFSRQQVLNPRVLVPSQVVLGLEPMLRRLIGEDIELVVAAADDVGTVEVDPTQLEQVIMNLVVNSRDAMPSGGLVTVRIANDSITPATAASYPYSVDAGPYVRFSVSDTGSGIDEETKKHIFEPFFTTKGAGHGTGLGLASVYGIVKQSGGHIWVRSDRGRGTTFDIWLPIVESERADDVETAAALDPQPVDTASVLLVEDDPAVRGLTRRILEREGHRVFAAAGPAEAFALVSRTAEPLHVLLTDVIMPDMNGRELAARLAELRPDMQTIFMSGYTEHEVMGRGGLDSMGDRFVQKPFTAHELLSALAGVLSAGAPALQSHD